MNALRSGAMLRAGANCAAVLARDCMPYRTCDQDAQSPYAQEPALLARFTREARAAAVLRNPSLEQSDG